MIFMKTFNPIYFKTIIDFKCNKSIDYKKIVFYKYGSIPIISPSFILINESVKYGNSFFKVFSVSNEKLLCYNILDNMIASIDYRYTEKRFYIDNIYVVPIYRKQSIGTTLLRYTEEEAKNVNISDITVDQSINFFLNLDLLDSI